jgi:hypothetical protein
LAVTTTHRIRFEGPSAVALRVARELAVADGIDLTSSEPPAPLDDVRYALEVTVRGARDAVARALDDIRRDLPAGASITLLDR